MTNPNPAADAVHVVGELLLFAEQALRLRLRSERSEISQAELDAYIAQWYRERPGAELGDCGGGVRERARG